jgi:hypothetical protein
VKKRYGYCLSLDGDNSIAIKLRTDKEELFRVEWIEHFSINDPDPGSRIEELAGSCRRVVQAIPNEQVSLMTVTLPNMKAKSQNTALQGLVVREKGGSFGDWVIDFNMVSGSQQGNVPGKHVSITAAVVKKEAVEKYYADAEQMGCYPRGMLPGHLALEQLLRHHGPVLESDGAWNLVFIGNKNQFICVGDNNDLFFSRNLPQNLSGSAGEDEYIERIAMEIKRSNFFAQQKERNIPVRRIIISGEPEKADKLVENLINQTEQEIIRWHPEEIFITDDKTILWEYTLNLAVAVTAFHQPRYNLMPPRAKHKSGKRIRHYSTLAAVVFGAAAVPVILIGGLLTSRVQGDFLQGAKAQLNTLHSRAGRAAESYLLNRALRDRQENIDKYECAQPELAPLLKSIAERTPGNIIYNSVEIVSENDDRFRLVIHGQSIARNGEQAQRIFLQFLDSLNACPHLQEFKEPENLEISGEDGGNMQLSRVTFALEYLIKEGK